MKKLVAIIRFGVTSPLKKEKDLISKILGNQLELGVGVSFGEMGIISVFYTDWTPSQISQSFAELAINTGDQLPVICWDFESDDAAINFEIPGFNEAIQRLKKEASTIPKECNLTLDELLDLVKEKGGVDQLSTSEFKRLTELSKS